MSTIIQIVILVIKFWPLIKAAVRVAEATFPIPKAGKDKLEAVLTAIGFAYDSTPELQTVSKENALKLAEKLAVKAVSDANASGEFAKVA